MIRIARGPEPEALRLERDERLARAILARNFGEKVDFSGYEIIKDQLARALHHKCAFCERDLRKDGNPVEHFRPKSGVLNEGESSMDTSRYWWLAWTWENLLFACFRCNTCYKKNQFPLRRGTAPLPKLASDTELEQALLLDPSLVDPRDHIRFGWSETRERWIAFAIEGSEMGMETIRVLGLDEDDDIQRHVDKHIEPLIKSFEAHVKRGDAELIREHWELMMDVLFHPEQAFHAFTWDVLDARVPQDQRRRWELMLPPTLGRHDRHQFAALPPFMARPELEVLPLELQLRVRALGSYAAWDEVRSALEDVLRLGDWSETELAALFKREDSTIRGWQQRLKSSPDGVE